MQNLINDCEFHEKDELKDFFGQDKEEEEEVNEELEKLRRLGTSCFDVDPIGLLFFKKSVAVHMLS